MNKETETMLIECHILMSEALKGYEDRAYMSNKLYEIIQYRNKLPEDIYKKIKEFADATIRPMVYDADYWSFVEKDESCGSYDENQHFIGNITYGGKKHNKGNHICFKSAKGRKPEDRGGMYDDEF